MSKKAIAVRLPAETVEYLDRLKELRGQSRNSSARFAVSLFLSEPALIKQKILSIYGASPYSTRGESHYNLYFEDTLLMRLDEIAASISLNRSEIVRVALADYIDVLEQIKTRTV